jgi:hypothetical protein
MCEFRMWKTIAESYPKGSWEFPVRAGRSGNSQLIYEDFTDSPRKFPESLLQICYQTVTT